MQHLKEIVLPNYPLVLSLLKYRNVWVFWNKKKSGLNRCSPLNSSIDNLYILRQFRKLVIAFFPIKNTPKLINQQLKNEVKIVNWQKEVSYWLFYCKKYSYLKLKNEIKIVN